MRTLSLLLIVSSAFAQTALNSPDCSLAFRSRCTHDPAWDPALLDRVTIPAWSVTLPENPSRGTTREAMPLVALEAGQSLGWEWSAQGQIWFQEGPPSPPQTLGWQIDPVAGAFLSHVYIDVAFFVAGTPVEFYVPPNWRGVLTFQAFMITPRAAAGIAVSATGVVVR